MESLAGGLVAVLVVLAAGWIVLLVVVWLHRPSRELAGPTLKLIPDLVRLVRSLLADAATPTAAKVALVGLLAYLLSPIDLIPDFLPGVGALDDVAIAALVLRWAGRRIGLSGLRAHWTGSEAGFALLSRLLGL